jgi:hypothetical protein
LDFTTSAEVLWKQLFDQKFGGDPDYGQLVTSKPKRRPWKEHYMRVGMTIRLNIKFEAHTGLLLTPEALHDLNVIQYRRVEKHNSWFYDGIAVQHMDILLDQLKRKLHIITRHDTLKMNEIGKQWVFDCHLGFAGQRLPFNIPTGIPNVQGDRSYYFRGTLQYSADYASRDLTFSLWHRPVAYV